MTAVGTLMFVTIDESDAQRVAAFLGRLLDERIGEVLRDELV